MAVVNYQLNSSTGALTEFTSTEGTITQDTSFKHSGGSSWKFGSGGTANINYATLGGVADAGNGHIVGFSWAADDTTPGAGEAFTWYAHATLDPFRNLGLGFAVNGDVTLLDDAGAVQGTYETGGGLTANTWYYFEFYFEVASGTSGKLGPLYIDDAEVIAQVTGLDTFDAAAPHQDRFLHNTFGAGPNVVWLDNYYHMSGASSIADRLGSPKARAAKLGGGARKMIGQRKVGRPGSLMGRR